MIMIQVILVSVKLTKHMTITGYQQLIVFNFLASYVAIIHKPLYIQALKLYDS